LKIVTIGEILWDVFPDAEHLGGAPFNFSAHAAKLGHQVTFVSAVSDDDRGRRALARAEELGLSTDYIGVTSEAPTGHVTVTISSDGQPRFVIHRPAAYDAATLPDDALHRLARTRPDWIAFGTLHQMDPRARSLLDRLVEAMPGARRFYDVNLRPDSYTRELIDRLLPLADTVKLNEDEMRELAPGTSAEQFCRESAREYGWDAVCVTRGAAGCWALLGDEFVTAPGFHVEVADAVGAGDGFSAAFLDGLGRGWPASRVIDFANRVGALIASRRGAIPDWTPSEAERLLPS